MTGIRRHERLHQNLLMESHQAILSHPISVNSLYRTRNDVSYVYKTKEAKDWQREQGEVLRYRYHWPEYPKLKRNRYFVHAQMAFSTKSHDVDNLMKLTQDTIATTIGINDTYFHVVPPIKVSVETEEEQGVQLWVDVCVMKDRAESALVALKLQKACPFHELLKEMGY